MFDAASPCTLGPLERVPEIFDYGFIFCYFFF